MILNVFLAVLGVIAVPAAAQAACPPALDFSVRTLAGTEQVNLCQRYLGKVILVVNTASRCGYTPQYDGLEALYQRYQDRGLVVLGFPSNDFANQEPGNEDQIQEFCRLTYGVKFPMFKKTRVLKEYADPFYRALADQAGRYPRWNFHKYLIDRQGRVIRDFPSSVRPDDPALISAIESLL